MRSNFKTVTYGYNNGNNTLLKKFDKSSYKPFSNSLKYVYFRYNKCITIEKTWPKWLYWLHSNKYMT